MIEAARLKVTVGADTDQAERGLRSFSGKLNNAARSMGMTGGIMTAGLTLPLVALGREALSSAADFEQSMNILAKVTGSPLDAMESLQEAALRLGAETSFSAGEAAEAMLELGKAGMNAAEISASISGVLDLAAAGGIGLAEAATVTSAALNTFSLDASESGRVANLLAAAANASSANISDLAAGMQQGGFAFAAAGQTLDDLVASLAILTNVGLTGSDAGTALKNALMRLMNPTKEAADLMRQLGITAYDAQGNMLPMSALIDEINGGLAGMTQEQANAALGTIFLSDGMKAMIPLLATGSAGFDKMKETINQEGAAAATAAARMAGLSGAVEYLSGSIDSFLIGAAQPFLATGASLIRWSADMITAFGALPASTRNAALAFGAVLAAAGPLVAALGGVAGALAFLSTPLGVAVAGMAALAAAFATDFAGIRTAAMETGQALSELSKNLQGMTPGEVASEVWRILSEGVKSIDFAGIREQIVLGLGLDNLAIDVKGLANFGSELTKQIATIDTVLTAFANEMIGKAANAITNADWSAMSVDFAGMVGTIAGRIKAIDWTAVGAAFADLGQTAKLNFAPLLTAIQGAWNEIDWSAISFSFVQMETEIQRAFNEFMIGATGGAGGDWAAITTKGKEIGAAIEAFEDSLMTATQFEGLQAALAEFSTKVGPAIEQYEDDVSANINALMTKFQADWTTLDTWAKGLQMEVSEFVLQTPGWLTELTGWQPSTPQWIADIVNWQPPMPDWIKWLPGFQTPASATVTGGDFPTPDILRGHLTIDEQSAQSALDSTLAMLQAAAANAPIPVPVTPQIAPVITSDILRGVYDSLGGGGGGSASSGEIMIEVSPTFTKLKAPAVPPVIDVQANVIGIAESLSPTSDLLSSAGNMISSTLSGFSWPSLPTWVWPTLPLFSWPSYPEWRWPPIAAPDWLNRLVVPRPSWLGEMLSWSPTVKVVSGGAPTVPGQIVGAASGMDYWRGGHLLVGERGREIVDLPRGSRVRSNRETEAILGNGGGQTVNITINATVSQPQDWDKVAYEVSRILTRRG